MQVRINPGDMIPEDRRRYLPAGEASPKGVKVFQGKRGGNFVDTIEEHIKSQGDPKDDGGIFHGLTAHPNHGPDTVQWPDGSSGPSNEPPEDDDGTEMKPESVLEKHQARTLRGTAIPLSATDVHISHDTDSPVQAKFRDSTGQLKSIITPEEHDKRRQAHWNRYGKFMKAYPNLTKKLDELAEDPDSMDDTDAIIYLANKGFFRHGNRDNPEARGASTLLSSDVEIEGDSCHFLFDSKAGMKTDKTIKDPVLARLLSNRLEDKGPEDRIFEGVEKRTNDRLSQHLGNKFSIKWLRTHGATQIALKELRKQMASMKRKGQSIKTKRDVSKIRKAVSLATGTELGHKRRITGTDPTEYEFTGDTADKHYISPTLWDTLNAHIETEEGGSIQKANTPDWHDKTPLEERDVDEFAEARRRKGENRFWGIKEFGGQRKPLVKTWNQSLSEQGFVAPVIKQTTDHQIWFLNNGIDYVGTFGMNGEVFVEKAMFKPTFNQPGISYSPSGRNKDVKTRGPNKDVQTLNSDELDDL